MCYFKGLKVKRKVTVLNYSRGSIVGDISVDSLVALLNEAGADASSESLATGMRDYVRGSILKRLEVLSFLIRDILPLVQMIFILFGGIYKSREDFVSSVLGFKYKGLIVGDCIVSSYFRDPKTPTVPGFYAKFNLYLLTSILRVSYQLRAIRRQLSNYNSDEALFFCFETTGFDEVARRYVAANGYCEIRYSLSHQGYRIFKGFTGVELRKALVSRSIFYETLGKEEISIGKNLLRNLVNRKVQYPYLKENDVDLNMKADIKTFPSKSTIILFLATLSDAQYIYGKSPFGDLHGFQERIIKWGLKNDLNVVVKTHPGMYREKDYTAKDRKYVEELRRDWCICSYSKNIERSTKNNRLYFVDSRLSVKELSKIFPNFLCVTQHGSVAAECAFLGHLGLVAINSQFFSKDKFVIRVERGSDLEGALDRWQCFKGFYSIEMESLYKYIYFNNVMCQDLYGSRILSKTLPEKLNSGDAEIFLADHLKKGSKSSRKFLVDEAVVFFKCQSNDFENVIVNGGG